MCVQYLCNIFNAHLVAESSGKVTIFQGQDFQQKCHLKQDFHQTVTKENLMQSGSSSSSRTLSKFHLNVFADCGFWCLSFLSPFWPLNHFCWVDL